MKPIILILTSNHRIQSRYFSPHSFNKFKSKLPRYAGNSCFSLLHKNVRSLKRNLENFQVHLLDELDYDFSLIGVSETKINSLKDVDFDPSISGYVFEHVPTPLASGGVGLYINDSLKHTVIEKTSEEAFQALWIEIQFPRKSNIICGIIYRQHNSPQRFQEYFDLTLEKLISSNKSVHITPRLPAMHFLLSLQSFSFIPTIDKPTRVYNNSATLIDNIFTNKVDVKITSGNIISDISDHYSQFCVFHTSLENSKSRGKSFRDFSGFSQDTFNFELYNALSNQINHGDSFDVDKAFSHFYDSLNVLVNKHAHLKTVSNRMRKQFSKPWITSGLKKSIKVKNFLLQSGNLVKYKFYRNKIYTLTKLSKKNYFHAFFSHNLNNMTI